MPQDTVRDTGLRSGGNDAPAAAAQVSGAAQLHFGAMSANATSRDLVGFSQFSLRLATSNATERIHPYYCPDVEDVVEQSEACFGRDSSGGHTSPRYNVFPKPEGLVDRQAGPKPRRRDFYPVNCTICIPPSRSRIQRAWRGNVLGLFD
jgi:hypothetical protein